MTCHRIFKTARLVLASAMLSATALPLAAASASMLPVLLANSSDNGVPTPPEGEIDPVVTGNTLPAGRISQWEEKRRKFLECGLCGKAQPFPDDLPVSNGQ